MLEMWVGAEVQRDKGEKDKMVVSVELVMIYGKGLEHLWALLVKARKIATGKFPNSRMIWRGGPTKGTSLKQEKNKTVTYIQIN